MIKIGVVFLFSLALNLVAEAQALGQFQNHKGGRQIIFSTNRNSFIQEVKSATEETYGAEEKLNAQIGVEMKKTATAEQLKMIDAAAASKQQQREAAAQALAETIRKDPHLAKAQLSRITDLKMGCSKQTVIDQLGIAGQYDGPNKILTIPLYVSNRFFFTSTGVLPDRIAVSFKFDDSDKLIKISVNTFTKSISVAN